MELNVQADETGALRVPPGLAPPGARFVVEARGETLILRRIRSEPEDWWDRTTPQERAAWLREWVTGLPPSPPISIEATRRDTIYDK